MFDAYTIKKVLPRLVAAAILIQLSWPLVTGLINIVTQLSWGLEGLMYLPFGGRSALSISKSLEAAGGGGSLFVLLTGGALWTFAGAPGLMALIIAILFALLTAFVTLIVRQVLMIALVLTAPLAIVAWILPNTEKFWKMWWGTFSKLLLMYPLILLILAGGRIGAHLLSNTDNNEVMTQIMVIIMFFAPFFLIPKTFSFAGGALAMVGGAIAARGSKLSGAANKRAWGKQAKNWSDRRTRADESRLFNPNGKFKRLNNLASTLVNPKAAAQIKMSKYGLGNSGTSLLSQIGQAKWDSTEKMAGVLSKSGMNDRALGALTRWDGTKKDLDRLTDQLSRGDSNDKLGAQQLASNAGFLLNAHKNEEYGRGSIAAAAGLAKASQGFITPKEIADISQRLDTDSSTGGLGLGNTFKTNAELAGGRAGALTKPGSSVEYSETRGWVPTDATGETRIKQAEKLGVQDIGSSKGLGFGEGTNQMGDTLVASLSGPNKSAKAEEIRSTLASAYHSYTTPVVKENIKNVLKKAREAELQNDTVYTTQMSPEQQQATLERLVATDLSRGNRPTTDEMNTSSQPPSPPEET